MCVHMANYHSTYQIITSLLFLVRFSFILVSVKPDQCVSVRGGVSNPFKLYKTTPHCEVLCSPQLELNDSDVGNALLVVEEHEEDGVDPLSWCNVPSTRQVFVLICYYCGRTTL